MLGSPGGTIPSARCSQAVSELQGKAGGPFLFPGGVCTNTLLHLTLRGTKQNINMEILYKQESIGNVTSLSGVGSVKMGAKPLALS